MRYATSAHDYAWRKLVFKILITDQNARIINAIRYSRFFTCILISVCLLIVYTMNTAFWHVLFAYVYRTRMYDRHTWVYLSRWWRNPTYTAGDAGSGETTDGRQPIGMVSLVRTTPFFWCFFLFLSISVFLFPTLPRNHVSFSCPE